MSNTPIDQEEEFHERKSKDSRKEKKRLSERDRSKYKKTDLEKKKEKRECQEGELQGRVLAILADGILVEHGEKLYNCSLRGVLKKENTKVKNLIAVGDIVYFLVEDTASTLSPQAGAIAAVQERHSILSRAEPLNRHKEQLIAVNVDQVLITASVILPQLKPFLIDRYIIAAIKGNMTPILLINKIDLLIKGSPEEALYKEVVSIYVKLGIQVISLSVITKEGLEMLLDTTSHKVSVFSGQSGSGKSSLINLLTGANLLTGEVVAKTGKGSHTTTSSCLLPIASGGFCVDTPGIKSFALWELKKEELQTYFYEIQKAAADCKYTSCRHQSEPGCAVRKAVEEGKISHLRFESYSALIKELDLPNRLR